MRKIIPLSLLNVVSLFAAEVSQGEMQSIYFEAVLFIGVFGTMGLISYIYSNRHAKAYSVSKEAIERREKEKVREKKKEGKNPETLSDAQRRAYNTRGVCCFTQPLLIASHCFQRCSHSLYSLKLSCS